VTRFSADPAGFPLVVPSKARKSARPPKVRASPHGLCSGTYILADALANSIEAQPGALIAGAFSVALAAILLFCLVKPRKGRRKVGFEPNKQDTFSPAKRLDRDRSRIRPPSRV
jgi:hypothetical protein